MSEKNTTVEEEIATLKAIMERVHRKGEEVTVILKKRARRYPVRFLSQIEILSATTPATHSCALESICNCRFCTTLPFYHA